MSATFTSSRYRVPPPELLLSSAPPESEPPHVEVKTGTDECSAFTSVLGPDLESVLGLLLHQSCGLPSDFFFSNSASITDRHQLP